MGNESVSDTNKPVTTPNVFQDSRPDWLKNIQEPGATIESLDVDGMTYNYTIVKRGLTSELPYVVRYEDNAFFISSDVPEEFRPFIVGHEVRETTNPEIQKLPMHERCRASLQMELADVQSHIPDSYVRYVRDRKAFFEALLAFYTSPRHKEDLAVREKNHPGFLSAITFGADYIRHVPLTFKPAPKP